MKASTARQLTNATAAAQGPANWIVRGGYKAGDTNNVLAKGLTYREARAYARAVREAGGYARTMRESADALETNPQGASK